MSAETNHEVVYLGFVKLANGSLGMAFIPFDQLGDLDQRRIRAKYSPFSKNGRALVVGGIYTADCKIENGTIQTMKFGSLKFDRRLDREIVAVWELISKSAEDDWKKARLEAKIKKSPRALQEIDALVDLIEKAPVGDHGGMIEAIADLIRAESLRRLKARLK